MIHMQCPRCQTVLAVEDTLAGTVLDCPDCAAKVRVPAAGDAVMEGTPPLPRQMERHDAVVDLDDRPPLPPSSASDWSDSTPPFISPRDAEVLGELELLQQQKTGWGGAIAILAISLLLYMGAAQVEDMMHGLFILIPVLFFHELGHYLAMRLFGYRNLRMFFVPFMGAGVIGQHYNVEGWKKAAVALAGPLPGIMLAGPVAIAGSALQQPTLSEAALLMLILNGLNLLPFLPLDGGWVVHAVLFVRHPVLEVVFRVIAALCLLGLAILIVGWCLMAVAVGMLLMTPLTYRLSRIAYQLREDGLVARSLDAHSIPTEAALQILAELRRVMPANTPAKTLAQHVVSVFETFNAEPPGPIVSIIILVVHASGFVAALVLAIIIAVLQRPLG